MREIAFTLTLVLAAPAMAAEMVVMDAQGISLRPGAVVAGERPLTLTAGQSVSLLSQSGRILTLTGPYDSAPEAGPSADDRSVVGALKEMVQTKQAKTSSLGVSRTGRTALPSPWLVDVSASDRICVREDRPLVLWRPDAARDLPLTLESGAVKASAVWPGGAQRLEGPPDIRPVDGEALTITVGDRSAVIQMTLVPATMHSDEMRLAWLVQKDCLTQAAALAHELE